MAVEARPKLDAHKLRADFPIFEREVNGKPLAYLDSAASAQKPRQVLDAIRDFYETSYANVHRGVYKLAEDATAGYEGARAKVATFLNAPSEREVIFTRSATEGINLVAYAWGLDNLGPGDVVVVTELEHHSNFVPWQYVAKRTGAEFRAIPFDDNGELVLDALDEIAAAGNVKVVANNLVSNSLGTINPSERLGAWAHEQGAIMVVDAAQAAPHRTVDVQALGADFVAISSHKMCGPTGVGALWGKRELLEQMSPFNLGGEMIRSVKLDRTTWNELPVQVRGRHARDRRGGRLRRGRRLPDRGRARGDRGARARAARVRAREARRDRRGHVATGRRRSGAPGSSRSTSTGSTRTTSRRCSTGRASRSAPATTARSR